MFCGRPAASQVKRNASRPNMTGQKKQPKHKVFGRDILRRSGQISGGRPGPKTFTPSLGAQENKVFCADVLDPKARTSMTRGGLRKTLCRKTSG